MRHAIPLCLAFLCASVSAPALSGIALEALADTYTQSDAPANNFGSSGIVAVAGNRIALIRFDAAAVARTTEPTATLQMKVLVAKNFNGAVSLHLITGPWNEKTVTANTLPPIAPEPLDQKTITAADQGKLVKFSVATALNAWRTNPAGNFGIAIMPASPSPNLQLGSREGGNAAVLAFGVNAVNNGVTVAVTGGDYRDVFTAADNALHGDTWCVHPASRRPCTIHIGRGVFPVPQTIVLDPGIALVGADESETILTSRAIPMIRAQGGSLISDLTAFGRQTVVLSEQATSGLSLERVHLQAEELDDDSRTVLLRNIKGTTTISDSDILSRRRFQTPVVGRQSPIVTAVEIYFSDPAATLRVQRSRLVADTPIAEDLNVGLFVHALPDMESLEIEDTSVTAREAIEAALYVGQNSVARQPIRITGGVLNGTVSIGATDLQITGTRVVGNITLISSGQTILDDVSVLVPGRAGANTPALTIRAGGLPPELLVLRSRLSGGSRALDADIPLFIENSILTQENEPTCRVYDAKGALAGC